MRKGSNNCISLLHGTLCRLTIGSLISSQQHCKYLHSLDATKRANSNLLHMIKVHKTGARQLSGLYIYTNFTTYIVSCHNVDNFDFLSKMFQLSFVCLEVLTNHGKLQRLLWAKAFTYTYYQYCVTNIATILFTS